MGSAKALEVVVGAKVDGAVSWTVCMAARWRSMRAGKWLETGSRWQEEESSTDEERVDFLAYFRFASRGDLGAGFARFVDVLHRFEELGLDAHADRGEMGGLRPEELQHRLGGMAELCDELRACA